MPAEEPQPPQADAPSFGASGRVRSSTAERERTATILRAAAEAGLLSLDEVDERMAACYQSQFRDQLAPLVADLPEHGRGLVPPDPEQQAAEQKARRSALRGLGRHATGVFTVAAVLVGLWALGGAGFFWPAWPLAFLALTLIFHAKRRARWYRWQQYAEHNGFPAHMGSQWGRHGHRRGPWWDEEYASRSW
jgi:hypothetical protein